MQFHGMIRIEFNELNLMQFIVPSLWPSGIDAEQVVSSIPGSAGYKSYPMFIEPMITWVPSGFSGYIRFDTKIVLK